MVDTIDVTQAQYFIPEIWAQEALAILRANIVLTPRVYSDSDIGGSFSVGDVLHVPYPGVLAASPKTAGTAYTLAIPTGETEAQVTLSSHEAVSFIVEDIVRAQANQDLIRNYSQAAAIALAEKIETDGFAEAVTNSADAIGAYGTALDFADVLTAWQVLTDRKVPSGDRFMAVAPKDLVGLLSDTDIQNWLAFSRGNQAASDPNNLGPLGGFAGVMASQLVPVTAATPTQTNNIAWRRDGLICAFRALPDPPAGSGAVAASVRDPESGVVLRSLLAYDATYGGVRVTIEALYGWQTLQAAKVLLVKS